MKITLLLVFLVSLPSVLGRPQTFRNSCLDQVNHLRQEYAQKYNIANMNQLVYDKNLEKNIMKSLEDYGSCAQKKQVKNGIIVLTGSSKNDELFNPDSSMMACVKSKCVETEEDVYSFAVDEGFSPMIYGSPGTRCPRDHSSSDNGLCAPPSSRKTHSRKNFLDNIDWDNLELPGMNKCVVGNCDFRRDYPPIKPEFPEEENPSKPGGFWESIFNASKRCKRCAVGPCPCW